MIETEFLIVGAGMSGLAFADAIGRRDYLICEADDEIGGYCKTITKDGFVWDYSGHFFHFRDPEIERQLVERMAGQRVLTIVKDARIYWKGGLIDFPFQKNIHQLPREDFIDCLHDLYFRDDRPASSFLEMLYAKFGRSIAEMFLVPYNEKLYATDLSTLDVDAMGRFFPHAKLEEIVRHWKGGRDGGYNATFTYPEGGAIQYVNAMMKGVDAEKLSLGERVERIDLGARVAHTNQREIHFETLVSSAPFPALLAMTGTAHDPGAFTWNKVLVFNLGFDRKGPRDIHWMYFPQRELSFYRVGFYDNIFGTDRMSLYVELGYPKDASFDVEAARARVLADLRTAGLVTDHELVAWHSVVLDPAYVHITKDSLRDVARIKSELAAHGVRSIGRYGSWTYCSIEDNIVEARALACSLAE
jgi:protoporphyrinogen oxidase